MKEIWKDIKGYKGLYQVSNLGRIRSLDRKISWHNQYNYCEKYVKGQIIKSNIDKDGYLVLRLNKNGYYKNKKVHRLVAEAFILNLKNKPEINHIDGNKQNNNIYNLEWCTSKQNAKHAWEHGLHKPIYYYKGKKGKKHNKSKIVYQIDKLTGRTINKFYGTHEASRETKIAQQSISSCCNNKLKTAGGYIWRYKEE